nr:MAG TPA: hypothetical protein [Caudoviricetes sp.]
MLKQLLQQLLNTRTTPGGAAHSASSTYTSPQWFNGTSTVGDKWTNGLYTGTAPNDGYLNISGSAYITTENVGSMIQAQIGDGQISQVSPMSGQGFNMLFPISKGASFSVNGIRLTDITVRFFKTIGGGYNRFVQRAVLCLKPLSNYLPRSFCKAKSSGSAAKPSLNRELSLVVRQEAMLHQRMDTSVSSILAVPEAICFLTLMQELLRVRRLQIAVSEIVGCFIATLSWAPLSLLKKGCQSILRPIQSQSRFGSVRQRVGVNLSAGGALC